MKRLPAAIRFLTILPLPGDGRSTPEDIAGAATFFPVVGVLIGAVMAALAIGLWSVFPAGAAAVLTVTAMLAVSGGFHMDGLSDTADGFFSARPKDRILEIMKDSHIGAMGVIAIVCVLLLKVAAMASLAEAEVWKAAFLMPVAGRCALVVGINVLPAARPDEGLGKVFCQNRSSLQSFWALGVLLTAGWFTSRWAGLTAVAAAVVVIVVFAVWCHRKIGGSTGDTLGATCELVETAVAITLAAKPVQLLA